MPRAPRTLALLLIPSAIFSCLVFYWMTNQRGDQAPGEPGTGLKVVVVGLDGAHLGLLSPLLGQGRLPNLRAFLEKASLGVMRSPIHEGFTSPALWTSIVTGLKPYEHGIADFVLPDPATCEDVAAATGHRTAPALWNILDQYGLRSAIVGLWATWPAESIDGAIVSDHVTYSRMKLSSKFQGADGGAVNYDYDTASRNVFPAALGKRVSDLVKLPKDVTAEDLRSFVPDFTDAEVQDILDGEYGESIQNADRFQELKVTLQSDRSYADIGKLLNAEIDPSLLLVYLEGIDVMEHGFWPYHDRDFPRHVDPPRERYQDVLNRYVERTDQLIGDYLRMADERTVVIVVSDHGYGTVHDPKHPSGHWHDHNAIFFAAGGPIKPRHILDPGVMSIYDLTPTVLALLGLPVGRDMAGQAVVDCLDPAFLEAHPIQEIESHGRRPLNPGDIGASAVDDEFRNRMNQIGYATGGSDHNRHTGIFDLDTWAKTPSVFARLATPCDVETGRAMFTSDPREHARPGRGPIPRCAIYTDGDGVEWPVVVIQIEETPAKTRVGIRRLDGTLLGTTIDRIELLSGPDERFDLE